VCPAGSHRRRHRQRLVTAIATAAAAVAAVICVGRGGNRFGHGRCRPKVRGDGFRSPDDASCRALPADRKDAQAQTAVDEFRARAHRTHRPGRMRTAEMRKAATLAGRTGRVDLDRPDRATNTASQARKRILCCFSIVRRAQCRWHACAAKDRSMRSRGTGSTSVMHSAPSSGAPHDSCLAIAQVTHGVCFAQGRAAQPLIGPSVDQAAGPGTAVRAVKWS
jgi:hypothetical protein